MEGVLVVWNVYESFEREQIIHVMLRRKKLQSMAWDIYNKHLNSWSHPHYFMKILDELCYQYLQVECYFDQYVWSQFELVCLGGFMRVRGEKELFLFSKLNNL